MLQLNGFDLDATKVYENDVLMTYEITSILITLTVAFILFMTEQVSTDLVALMFQGSLALTGIMSSPGALIGFSCAVVESV